MIRAAFLGASRLLFIAAITIIAVAFGLAYLAIRLAKAAYKGRAPMPVRDASFQALLALVAVAQALKAQAEKGGHEWPSQKPQEQSETPEPEPSQHTTLAPPA